MEHKIKILGHLAHTKIKFIIRNRNLNKIKINCYFFNVPDFTIISAYFGATSFGSNASS